MVVTPVIGTLPEGTTFDVRPVVSADRKYIYQKYPFDVQGVNTSATTEDILEAIRESKARQSRYLPRRT